MARQKIREYEVKKLILRDLHQNYKGILVKTSTDIENLPKEHSWLLQEKLVIKPDQLFGKRGKLGLVLLDADFNRVKEYLKEKMNQEITIGKATDKLTHFLIEPYIPHEKEYYLCITSQRDKDIIYFSEQGGMDVEENWDKVAKIELTSLADADDLNLNLPVEINTFVKQVFSLFKEHHFCYLEFNPFTIDRNGTIILLDTVAQADGCASNLPFPKPFGRKSHREEEFIQQLDKESGASLKLTILNPQGRIWNILSGGGASIIYLDTIADLGKPEEIANYGEYSGNPTAEETYQYAKTILHLMTKEQDPKGKVLIIGGAVANFTDVEKTFQGVVRALREYKDGLRQGNISIFVRRGGPNYKKGLQLMQEAGKELQIPIAVHGPEMPMTAIVEKAIEALR